MGEVNRWWLLDPKERYWLESTDRDDLGANLHAPERDDVGRENWRYALCREMREGDIVFHYMKPERGIVARSVVASRARSSPIVWGARGTSARAKGVSPYGRPGLLVELRDFRRRPSPLSIHALIERQSEIRALRDRLARLHKSLYFPFELSGKRELRALQGYVFKLPAEFVSMFRELDPAAGRSGSPTSEEEPTTDSDRLERAVNERRRARREGKPVGNARANERPQRATTSVVVFERLASVVDHALWRAQGRCESCQAAPFLKTDGEVFLEVHHVRMLADGGPDCVENAVALCPNCHRAMHYADDREARRERLFGQVPELRRF